MDSSLDWRRRVAGEFDCAVSEVIGSLISDGYSLFAAANILGISSHTLKSECQRIGLEFKRYQQSPDRKKHSLVNHQKNTRFIEYAGERLHLSEWARRLNMGHHTIIYRLDVMGLSTHDAFTRPVCKHNHAR